MMLPAKNNEGDLAMKNSAGIATSWSRHPSNQEASANRVLLRTFEESDLASLKELHFDENVMRFLGGGVRTDLQIVQADLQKYIEHQTKYGYSKWVVLHKDTSEFMGRAGLIKVPNSDEIDLVYALHQSYWKQVYF